MLKEKLQSIEKSMKYYNKDHTNVHGSIKYTRHLSEILIDKYGFKNKKNDNAW